MGKRGPKKKPAAIKKQQGTYRPDRDAGVELPAVVKVPPCPTFLTSEAKAVWELLGPELVESKLLTNVDILAFALLCQAWSDWIEAVNTIKKTGIIAKTEGGNVYQHPAVGVRNRSWYLVMKGCQEFGLTPSSRTGLLIAKAATDPEGDSLSPEEKAILGIQ